MIRCLVMEPQQPSLTEKLPLVLVHGFGCGIVQFYKNLDHLHSDRRVYALDLPGFARSTRIPFPEEAEAVEAAFVSALERWREGVGLERFVLLGHSLGGFLSLSYAMSHPHRVRHLILDDPWGLVDPIPEDELREKYSFFARGIFQIARKFKPFDWIRGFGPLGTNYDISAKWYKTVCTHVLVHVYFVCHVYTVSFFFFRSACFEEIEKRFTEQVWRQFHGLHLP